MLPIIILVWGLVFYQLFSYFFSSPTYAREETKIDINIDAIQVDTFSIVADYRDPFLGKKATSNRVASTYVNRINKTNRISPQPPKSTNKPWPIIKYKGMIKNNNSEKRVGIVNINGKERLVKEGDILNDLKVVSIAKKSIIVSFQKEQKEITI